MVRRFDIVIPCGMPMLHRKWTDTERPGGGAPRIAAFAAVAGLCLAAPAVAQDPIPPVPPDDLRAIEMPIWEDSPGERHFGDTPEAGEGPGAGSGSDVERSELDPVGSAGTPGEPGPAAAVSAPPDVESGPLPDPAISGSVVKVGRPDSPKQAFRVGLVPRGDTAAFLAALEPMRSALSDSLGRPVEILPMPSLSALIDAQALRRVDLAFYSASAHVTADRLCRCVEPLAAPVAADGTAAIHAVIVVRRDSGFGTVDDLAGRTVAAAGAGSVGARLYQLASLKDEGIDPESHFAAIVDAGSSADAVLEVRDGIVDAAFAWTSFAGDAKAGYSRGTFTFLVANGQLDMDDIAIVWQSSPLAHGPASVLDTLSEGDKAVVEAFLTGLAARDPQSYDRLDPYYGGGYQPVDPVDYRGARLLAEIDVRGLVAPQERSVPRVRPRATMPTVDRPQVQPEPGETGSIITLSPPGN